MNIKPSIYLLVLIISVSLSCDTDTRNNKSIRGIWKSIGYGKVLKIDSSSYAFFDMTKISCIPDMEGPITDWDNAISLVNDTLSIQRGFSVYTFERIVKLPEFCEQNSPNNNDPLYNFEVFSENYNTHYEYLKLNKVNWDSIYTVSKSKINTNTTEAELYVILEGMLGVFNDNHGSIEPTDDVYEMAMQLKKEGYNDHELKSYGDFEIARLVADHYLEENMTKDSRIVKWGKMKNNIGYVQINAMMLFADLHLSEGDIEEQGFVQTYFDAYEKLSPVTQLRKEVAGIRTIMNKVISDLETTQYIILDVRFNGGGNDEVGLEILRHFNSERRQVASKKARSKNGYTSQVNIYLDASEKPYIKSVYLLTSQQSASATDMMVLSSLELNQFKRIGSHTQGALSDALQKKLPNGWYFSLSNEVYTDNQGMCYESIGIPVDYELNYPDDRQSFFRSVAADLEADKQNILMAVKDLELK